MEASSQIQRSQTQSNQTNNTFCKVFSRVTCAALGIISLIGWTVAAWHFYPDFAGHSFYYFGADSIGIALITSGICYTLWPTDQRSAKTETKMNIPEALPINTPNQQLPGLDKGTQPQPQIESTFNLRTLRSLKKGELNQLNWNECVDLVGTIEDFFPTANFQINETAAKLQCLNVDVLKVIGHKLGSTRLNLLNNEQLNWLDWDQFDNLEKVVEDLFSMSPERLKKTEERLRALNTYSEALWKCLSEEQKALTLSVFEEGHEAPPLYRKQLS